MMNNIEKIQAYIKRYNTVIFHIHDRDMFTTKFDVLTMENETEE